MMEDSKMFEGSRKMPESTQSYEKSTSLRNKKPKENNPKQQSELTKHYGELLTKCISINSAVESSDARYAINQLDQKLRLMGLRATIKIGIEKID